MPVVLPVNLTDGTTAHGPALAAKFTEGAGGIANSDIATAAAIVGTKLADRSIPGGKLILEAVTDAELASDSATPGSDSGRAVSGDHIKTLTDAQLARIFPAAGLSALRVAAAAIGTDRLAF